MRARDAIGRRVVAVKQTRTHDGRDAFHWHLVAIVLDDGTRLVPSVVETNTGEYIVTLTAFTRD